MWLYMVHTKNCIFIFGQKYMLGGVECLVISVNVMCCIVMDDLNIL